MGTNFYVTDIERICPCCRKWGECVHIGKRVGAGEGRTKFLLRTYLHGDDDLPNNVEEWEHYLTTRKDRIYDEYGDSVSLDQMLEILLTTDGEDDRPFS